MKKDRIREEQNGKFRLSRLNIFLSDFREAHRLAQYILTRKWPKVINPQSKSGLVYLAFNTSLIISYARPFHKSKDGVGLPRARLNPDLGGLNDGERAFHQRILDLRDQAYAHSDASEHEIEGWDYSGSSVQLYKSIDLLTKDETRRLTAMIGKWIGHLEEQRSIMKKAKSVRNRLR